MIPIVKPEIDKLVENIKEAIRNAKYTVYDCLQLMVNKINEIVSMENENGEILEANENERINNENLRVQAELVRADGESQRIENETERKENEAERVAAEKAREATMESMGVLWQKVVECPQSGSISELIDTSGGGLLVVEALVYPSMVGTAYDMYASLNGSEVDTVDIKYPEQVVAMIECDGGEMLEIDSTGGIVFRMSVYKL